MGTTPTPQTGNSTQMVDDINAVKGVRKLSTSALIRPATPFQGTLKLDRIITADLESLITKEGLNTIYMAAWYNGQVHHIFDITHFKNNPHKMLMAFWLHLLQDCPEEWL